MRVKRLAIGSMAAVALMTGLTMEPASAEMPTVSCTTRTIMTIPPPGDTSFDRVYCVSFTNGLIRAAVTTKNGETACIIAGCPQVRVQLVYYPGYYYNRGESVISWSGVETTIYPALYGNVGTPGVTNGWQEGIYCSRIYQYNTGFYADTHCANTNGSSFSGSTTGWGAKYV